MRDMGPPWEYIDPAYIYGFGAIAVLVLSVLLLILLGIFVNGFFKRRHELRVARIQSGNLDPIQTQAGAFLVLRRGIILTLLGLNVALSALADHPLPLAFLPFTLGLAYLVIYLVHTSGILKLFPAHGLQGAPVEQGVAVQGNV